MAVILGKVGLTTDTHMLLEEKPGQPPLPLPADKPVYIHGCELFHVQVNTGGVVRRESLMEFPTEQIESPKPYCALLRRGRRNDVLLPGENAAASGLHAVDVRRSSLSFQPRQIPIATLPVRQGRVTLQPQLERD